MYFAPLASFLLRAALFLAAALSIRFLLGRRLPVGLRFRLDLVAFLALPLLAVLSLPITMPIASPKAAISALPGPPLEGGSLGDGRGLAASPRGAKGLRAASQSPGTIEVPRPVAEAIVLVWLAGALLCLASRIISHISLWLAARRLKPCVDPQWLSALAAAERKFGIAHRIMLVVDEGRPPYSGGMLTSWIAVPTSGPLWSQGRKETAMLHEVAHVKRGDAALMCLARLLSSLVWPIPFAELLLAYMGQDREEACDELAIRQGADPIEFAQLMLDLAAPPRALPRASAAGISQARNLERRIRMILEQTKALKPSRRGVAIAAFAALAAFGLGAALLPSAFAEKSPPKETEARQAALIELQGCDAEGRVSTLAYELAALPLADPLDAGPWHITLGFGANANPLTGKPFVHRGIDISDYRLGDTVRSTMAGSVVESGFDVGYGYFLVIAEGKLSTLYAHLDRGRPGQGFGYRAGGEDRRGR